MEKNFGTISLHNSGNENGFILKCNKHLLGRSFSSFNCRPYNREDGIGQCNETLFQLCDICYKLIR